MAKKKYTNYLLPNNQSLPVTIVALLLILCVLILVSYTGIRILNALRVFSVGESSYSRAQKDACFNLVNYVHSPDQEIWTNYEAELAKPLAYRKARMELQKDRSDLKVVKQNLVKGGTASDETDEIIFLYKNFGNLQIVNEALAYWQSADSLLIAVESLANKINASSPYTDAPELRKTHLQQLIALNSELTKQQQKFSNQMSLASQYFAVRIRWFSLSSIIILSLLGFGITVITYSRLNRTQREYESLFKSISDLIFIADSSGRILDINPAGARMLEYTPDELHNFGDLTALLANSWQKKKLLYFISKKKQFQDQELVLVSKKGKPIQLLGTVTFTEEKGKTIIKGILKDIGPRKKLFAELEEKRVLFNKIFDESSDAIFLSEIENNTVIDCNKTTLKLFNASSKEEILGKPSISFQAKPWDEITRMSVRKELEEKGSWQGEVEYIGLTEKKLWGETAVSQIHVNNSSFNIVRVIDISEKKKQNKLIKKKNLELKKVNKELDLIIYSLSHDLRAPLNSIQGLISLGTKDANASQKEYFSHMESSIKSLKSYIQDIVNYSQSANTDLKVTRINFNTLINTSIEQIRFMSNAEKITFNLNNGSTLAFYSDESRINIILNNLLSNAIKYHDFQKKRPHVEVSVRDHGKDVQITISDNGLGIEKGVQKKVFDMFYSTGAGHDSTGLGLYLVKETTDKLRGKIKLQSVPGAGSNFSIVLPNLKSFNDE